MKATTRVQLFMAVLVIILLPSVFSVSQEIILQTNITQNLGDGMVDAAEADTVRTSVDPIYIQDGTNGQGQQIRGYYTFNISNISSCDPSKMSARLSMFQVDSSPSNDLLSVHEVNVTTIDYSTLTWNTQPCGTVLFDNAANCNLTAANSTNVSSTLNTWFHWNITTIVRKAIQSNKNNFTFVVKLDIENNPQQYHGFTSANGALVGNSSIVNVTCDIATDSTAPIITGALNNTAPRISEQVNATFNITEETALRHGNISINLSPRVTYNFTLSGLAAQISQNFTIGLPAGAVLNITGVAADTSGNQKQSTTVFVVVASPPDDPPSVPSTSGAGGSGNGGGQIGATRQCMEYAQAYRQCYYFEAAVNACARGCPIPRVCSAAFTCEDSATNVTGQSLIASASRALAKPKTLWGRLTTWFSGLMSLSTNDAPAFVSELPSTSSESPGPAPGAAQPAQESTGEGSGQDGAPSHPALPYMAIGAIFAIVVMWYFSLFSVIWKFIIGLSIVGILVILVVAAAVALIAWRGSI